MWNPLSGLTVRGRCLLAAGVATAGSAVLLDERDLLRIAVFVILLPLLLLLFTRTGGVAVTARRALPETAPTAGENSEIELLLWRAGRLPPGRLLLTETTADISGNPPRFGVTELPRRSAVALRYTIRPGRRGQYRIGPLRSTITDAFGLVELDRVLCPPSELLVLPPVDPLHERVTSAVGTATDSGRSSTHTGEGVPDAVVRQYREGDDIRKVHWPSTARHDEIMVRQAEQPAGGSTTVLLDCRAVGHIGHTPESSLDWAVSFAASVCLCISMSGQPVRLISESGDPLANLPGNARHADRTQLLETLATIQPTGTTTLSGIARTPRTDQLVAVLGALDTVTVHAMLRQRTRPQVNLAVLLDNTAGADTVQHASLLDTAGWRTVTTTPTTDLKYVWQRLCAASRHPTLSTGGRR